MRNIKILLLEDDKIDQINFERLVKNECLSYDYVIASSISEARQHLSTTKPFDIVIADYLLGDGTVFDILNLDLDLPVIFTTGAGDEEIAVKAMKAGAYDYLIKDNDRNYLKILPITIENAIRHKKTEYTLRLLQFEHNVAGVFRLSTKGDILECNETFADILGYASREEALETRASIFYTLDDTKAFLNKLQEIWLLKNYELRLRHRDGHLIDVLTNVSLLEEEDGTGIIQGTLIDITERKRIEASLEEERNLLTQRVAERTEKLKQANAKLAEANRLKDEFLAGMSHELRTPLSAILGMSEALQTGLYGALNEDQQEPLRTITKSGQHLLALINDILDIARIEAGKLELNVTRVNVESVCKASLELINSLAVKKQLQVRYTIDDAAQALEVDKRRLQQILANLLSNAVKFTATNGAIGLEVVGDKEAEIIQFTVWDTGVGIAEEDLQHLFEPFKQLDNRLSRRHEGAGLGLSLVYHMADMHGGSVSVQSEVGQGSRFTVALPWPHSIQNKIVEAVEITDIPAAPSVFTRVQDKNTMPLILVAEDNELNSLILCKCLQAAGYRVSVAWDGNEAIKRAREERPDLILMDVQMPGMDGLEATRRLRADAELAAIPIIALTALAMSGDRERCLEAGADDYFSKPINMQELVQLVETRFNADDRT